VIHLIAELVDNATSFSSPRSQVEVHSSEVPQGLVIEIEDHGLGIKPEDREQHNKMLAAPPDFEAMRLRGESRLGLFVVARLDGAPVGCGALKMTEGGVGEIKRMWTDVEARGLGIARRILRKLESEAMALGLERLRLETNRTLVEAQSLYRSAGYVEVARFNDEPYAHHWFEKRL